MRKNIRKLSLVILALTAVSLGAVATGNLSLRTAAAEEIKTLPSFRLENVSVRLKLPGESNGGFRFESLISQGTYDGLTNVTEVGTLFTITAMSEDSLVMGASNVAKIVLEGTVGEENRRGGEKTTDNEGVAVISYRAFINDIPDTAFDTDVMARSYVIADGETYYTDVVTQSIGDVARDAYYNVQETQDGEHTEIVQDGWYSPFTLAQREEISKYITTTEKTYAPQYVLVENGEATLDLTKLSVAENDVVGVMVDDKFTEWSVEDSTLTYATDVGQKTLTLATKEGVYDIALVQADNVIKTWEDFSAWGGLPTGAALDDNAMGVYEYTVLANDITYDGTGSFEFIGNFNKTFDGLGHTIVNLTAKHGIVRGLATGGVWKNVNYVGFKQADGTWGILSARLRGGTFENVHIEGEFNAGSNYLAASVEANTIIRDCSFTIKNNNSSVKSLAGKTTKAVTLINTTVNYSETINEEYKSNANIILTDSTINSNYTFPTTNYYAKVSGGTATFELSQMGETAPTTIGKLMVNGVEVQPTIENGVLSYPATNTGATTLIMTTDKGVRIMNIVHADNVITTWDEFSKWGTDANKLNAYEYTVLGDNIIYGGGTTSFQFLTNFDKTFDGLGHTIENLVAEHGIVRRLVTGGIWKNVNYTNFKLSGNWGILGAGLSGGTFENVTIEGSFGQTGSKWFLGRDNNQGDKVTTTIRNCTFTLTDTTNVARTLISTTATHDINKVDIINTTINYSGKLSYNSEKVNLIDNSKINSNVA